MTVDNITDIFIAKRYGGKWYKIFIQARKIDHSIDNNITIFIAKPKTEGSQTELLGDPIAVDLKQVKYAIKKK